MKVIVLGLLLCAMNALGEEVQAERSGMVTLRSAHDFHTTAQGLAAAMEQKGMRVFQRIDHAKNARAVGISLRPTEVFIFGNPAVGSKLMQCSQSVALDLPQKALVWTDSAGQVWVAYNDMAYLAGRHGMQGCEALTKKVAAVLSDLFKGVVGS